MRDPRAVAGRDVGQQYIVSMPIIADGKPLGVLHIGIDSVFVDRVLLEVLLDVLVVLVVSLFFTLELLNFMAGARASPRAWVISPRQVDRMNGGDFTPSGRIRVNDEIGRLLRWIDSSIDHINVRYENARRRSAPPPGRVQTRRCAST
jgi:hypothetical protein